jgi:cytochrome c oxidase accessory protein FixG
MTSRAVDRHPDLDSLYCINADGSRNRIHPADVRGRYQSRKRIIQAILILVWIVLPWVTVDGRPAILIDIEHRSFFLFGQTFNAQDFGFVFFLLTGIGITLFIISAVFGRVWCGYACPHTVFLEGVYRRIERWIDGSATQRKKLEAAALSGALLRKRLLKHGLYVLVSLFLAHNVLSYFFGAHHVLDAITSSPTKHPFAFGFTMVSALLVYGNFAFFREQLCIVICPYGRLQGVLYDPDTVNVAYDHVRGEPRGRYSDAGKGDCIDCFRCVAVCPTGIDIRNGTQLECIGCANCIDACDEVMTKVGRPTGLVRYDSQNGVEHGRRRILRPRVWFYIVMVLIGAGVFGYAAFNRAPFEAKLLRQQGSPFDIDEQRVRNALVLQIVNKQPRSHEFVIEPVASPGVRFTLPQPRVTLDTLVDQRIPLWVEVDRSVWKLGQVATIKVRTADGTLERSTEIKIAGPR